MLKRIHNLLILKKKTISTAESCTGGLLSSQLTSLSGSSQYFILGVTTYSNKAKNIILKIPDKLISKYGAVSSVISKKMAVSVKKLAKTDYSISITGIAGPTGATKTKPVGTVFISLSSKNKLICKKFLFKGSRDKIREQSTTTALKLLLQLISN